MSERTNKCPDCGLRYRGVKAGQKPTDEKVERHEAGYHHKTRIETLKGKKW